VTNRNKLAIKKIITPNGLKRVFWVFWFLVLLVGFCGPVVCLYRLVAALYCLDAPDGVLFVCLYCFVASLF
jgi:hypothetical protein